MCEVVKDDALLVVFECNGALLERDDNARAMYYAILSFDPFQAQ